jgi:hypothetical protein
VTEGEYDLVVDRWDYLPQSIEGVRAVSDLEPISVTLPRAYVLGGRVLDSAGKPLPRAHITVVGVDAGKRETKTGDDGRFLVGKLGVGRYQVYAEEQQSGVGLTQGAVVPGSEIELVLPETSSVPSSR